jgi:conjugal transfer pilus assembly protein TraV
VNRAIILVPVAALFLSGCAGLSRNVAGSWRCSAGEGTCAPLSSIDETALARAYGGTAAPMPLSSPTARVPLLAPFSDQAQPGRSDERTLRIVFPAHVDSQGLYHEPAAVHAVVERPTWVPPRATDVAGSGGPAAAAARAQAVPMSPQPVVRLATPEEAVAMLPSARARPLPSEARPVQSASDPVAGPEGAAEGFPPFPASALSQRTGAPAVSRSPAAAGALLPPAVEPPSAALAEPVAPAPVLSLADKPRLSPGDDPSAGARLLNSQQLATLPKAAPAPPATIAAPIHDMRPAIDVSAALLPAEPVSGDEQ